ncbi:MAG: uroporphyrinogen decarboxylase [Ktedonobacterales bacterium]
MNDRFLRACWREPVDRTPIWFMRQAGRALPEYRALKQGHSLLEITRQPELAARITLQPVRRLGVDAAILYADIMSPLVAIGVDLEIVEGKGPVIARPFAAASDLEALRALDAADVPHITETIRILRRELAAGGTPLIGFAGAPFTLASYLIEGHATRDFARTKALLRDEPALWHALMERLATMVIGYGRAQIEAGVQAFQLFDSWIGALSPDEYSAAIQPHVARIFSALAALTPRVPLIHFGTGTQLLIEPMAAAGGDVFGLDWHPPLDAGWRRAGGPERMAIQGNLDPHVLLEPWEVVRAAADDVLRRAGGRPGHIFNLGHGILPATPVETLERLVAYVHEKAGAA